MKDRIGPGSIIELPESYGIFRRNLARMRGLRGISAREAGKSETLPAGTKLPAAQAKPTIENVILVNHTEVSVSQDFVSIVSPYVVAETLSPKLESNFNRLVVFFELGSSGEESGFATVCRGPPKIFS